MNRKQIRAAWTQLIDGVPPEKKSKYRAERTGKYASRHEADTAAKLHALYRAGKLWNLEEQKRIELVAGDEKVEGVTYIADFVYDDCTGHHVLDAKGVKTPVYKLKKRLAWLLKGIRIEEV